MSLARNATVNQSPNYERHQPEQTLLYPLVEQQYPAFKVALEAQGQNLPLYIQQEFEDFLQCGRLEYGFLRVRCEDCHHERLVVFSCKRRGFCPSCGARRMAASTALLVDEVFPKVPIRQWVLSFPFQLRFLLARHPSIKWACHSPSGHPRPNLRGLGKRKLTTVSRLWSKIMLGYRILSGIIRYGYRVSRQSMRCK